MINAHEKITVDYNFVLHMNFDIEDVKTLRGTFKQNVGVASIINSKYCDKNKILRLEEEATSESKDALTKLTESTLRNSLKNWYNYIFFMCGKHVIIILGNLITE